MDTLSALTAIFALAGAAIIGGILYIHLTVGLNFDVLPLRIFWPSKVKAYRKLRLERIQVGRFFTVTSACGHSLELRGIDLCTQLDKVGEYIQCPHCLRWVKVISVIDGQLMNDGEKERQMKEYQEWKEAMERLSDHPGLGY